MADALSPQAIVDNNDGGMSHEENFARHAGGRYGSGGYAGIGAGICGR